MPHLPLHDSGLDCSLLIAHLPLEAWLMCSFHPLMRGRAVRAPDRKAKGSWVVSTRLRMRIGTLNPASASLPLLPSREERVGERRAPQESPLPSPLPTRSSRGEGVRYLQFQAMVHGELPLAYARTLG